MTEPQDRFARFVDILTECLDEPDLRGEDIAARAFRSRYHFDRQVAAVAGETPARFRRRVLLERAAFRLVTTRLNVLDIALEAGYASNEAFTRAFQRAYGRAPSIWRAAPGPIKLASPNDVHFHPPAGLRFPARSEVSSMDLLVKMVEHHVWLTGAMISSAAGMSEERLDAPIELLVAGIDHAPTARSLLSRLVGQMDMWNCAIAMRDYDFGIEAHESLTDLRERLAMVAPVFLEQVRTVVAEGRLDEAFVDALCEPAEVFTFGGMIAHVLTFSAYRRTLVAGALESAGIEALGNGDPMRWVAEATT